MAHPRPRDQRGFSLIVVFLIIVVMAAVATGVMTSTQGDLQVSGYDRESAVAFYAAEAGVAVAHQTLKGRVDASNPRSTWTSTLAAGWPEACTPSGDPKVPGIVPAGVPTLFDASRKAYYTWCFHNNALDKNYATGTGDFVDDDNVIVIESVGVTGGDGRPSTLGSVSSRVSVELRYGGGGVFEPNSFQRGGGMAQRNSGEAPTLGSIAARVVVK